MKGEEIKKVLFFFLTFLCFIIMCSKTSKIIYPANIMPEILNPKAKLVAEILFPISPGEKKSFYYQFAKGDTILFNAWTVKGNDISEISIIKWPDIPIVSAYGIRELTNKKIFVEKNSIYLFEFKNSSNWSSKTYKFTLHRVPTIEKYLNFSTDVEWITTYETTYVTKIESILVGIDTVWEDVVNTQRKISAGEFSIIEFGFPQNTAFWAYWIGVGEEAANGLKEMVSKLPEAASLLGISDPVVAFALGLVPQLFSLNKGKDINYEFYTSYFDVFLKGEKIITEYGKRETPKEGKCYLKLNNSYSILTPKLVTVRIVAIKLKYNYQIHQIKIPQIKTIRIPKIPKE